MMWNHSLRLSFVASSIAQGWRWCVRVCGLLCLISLISLISACTAISKPQINLALQVEPAGRPGVYVVNGTTNLPEGSRLTIAGVRYLSAQTAPTIAGASDANYSILARQTADVAQGKWQATLNLWQVAPDGQFQEAWQLSQSQLGFSQQPADQVIFIATFEPNNQPPAVRDQFASNTTAMDSTLTRFSSDGQRFLQISQTLPVSLPSGKTTPPTVTAADLNGGWGDRANLEPPKPTTGAVTIQAPETEQTNAPLNATEFLR